MNWHNENKFEREDGINLLFCFRCLVVSVPMTPGMRGAAVAQIYLLLRSYIPLFGCRLSQPCNGMSNSF